MFRSIWKVAFLDQFGKKGIGEPLRIGKAQIKQLKVFFVYLLGWVRVFIGDSVTSLIDFVDWLGSPQGAVIFCAFLPLLVFVYVYIVYTFFNTILLLTIKKKMIPATSLFVFDNLITASEFFLLSSQSILFLSFLIPFSSFLVTLVSRFLKETTNQLWLPT